MMKLFGLGNPLIETMVSVPKSFLAKHNLILGTHNIVKDDKLPMFEELKKDFDH
jgi:hypothetical protein